MSTDPEDNGDGHVDGFDESEELSDGDQVTIVDDEGNEVNCLVLAVLEHEGEEYALLGRMDQLEAEDGEEVEVFVFRQLIDEEGQQVFESIEDEETYEAVRREFSTIMEQDEA